METVSPTLFGLLATAILLTTLSAQTVKQWREHATHGIARWFFLGQVSASVCFVIYSLLIHSTLFAVANGLILLSALAGYVVLRINRRRVLRLPKASSSPTPVNRERLPAPHVRVALL